MYGEITQHDVKVLELSALKGVFEDVVDETVSYVNAPLFAQERGVEVRLTTSSESADHRNVVTVRGTLSDGEEISVSGTLAGPQARPEDRRGRRLRRGPRARRPHGGPALRGPSRASSAPWAASSARRASTSPACRSPARRSAGEALAVLTVDDTVSATVLGELASEIGRDLGPVGEPGLTPPFVGLTRRTG
ncbi:hypothetical protein GCM10019016_004430 [Streptomyces prasinosporus]|uniref:D-3-phosphoglycerate dehydrogenase ASB domain-containing protein n=1 Tax=Streptomyces prasinosporus TaxID=68256 RepID=A0ABP6TEV9_9ACTN